ncbi:tetratricopeptide repeat protein [Clostridium hydrogenum]|uniref:tetratricopeptide repeat protein n=1 Tax=Clostridium hydrogenum TaxID=2855764 RepID=UPI001F23E72A|nr:hypothetical protein [Clostridium hydrogenum]
MSKKSELKNEILKYIEKCIDEGKIKEAEMLIEEYEKKIRYDVDIYSYKAIVKILRNDLEAAEIILVKGLILDIKNFDLLYNLAYIYEVKKAYTKAKGIYTYANLYCTDKNLKIEIQNKIAQIKEVNHGKIGFLQEILLKALENANNIGYDDQLENLNFTEYRDKKYISDNIEEILRLYNNISEEDSKKSLIAVISNVILQNTEVFNIEDSDDNKKIISIKKDKEVSYVGIKTSVEEEINKFLNELGTIERDEVILIFGLALGDHVLSLAEKTSENNRIIVIEPKIEIINLFKLSLNFNKLNIYNRISIFFYKDKELENVLSRVYEQNCQVKFQCYSNYKSNFEMQFEEFVSKLKLSFKVEHELQPEGFDYLIKEFMQSEDIEVMVTGISYAVFGFYPPFMKRKTFNFALPSQDIYFDYEIVKFAMNFNKAISNLKYVIISLCHYSFENDLSLSKQNAGILHRYIEVIKKTHNYDNVRGIKMLHQIYKQIYSINYYHYNVFAKDFIRNINEADILNQRDLAQKQSSNNFPDTVIENEKILGEYLNFLYKRNIKPIVVVCPASKLYTQYYDSNSSNRFYNSINKLQNKYKFQMLDYFYSDKFDESDYYDGSHLNIKGAKKFAEILEEDIIW